MDNDLNESIDNQKNIGQFVARSESKLSEQNENPTIRLGTIFEINSQYDSHPFAEILPEATEAEYQILLEDMRVHGQYEPIIIFEDKIADGRTRKKVQDHLNRPTLAQTWVGTADELLNYLYSKSQHRHLTSQQCAVIALQFVKAEKQLAKKRQGMRNNIEKIVNTVQGRATEIVAKHNNTNRTYLAYAEKICERAPELLDYVKQNQFPIAKAKQLAEKIDSSEDRIKVVEKYKEKRCNINELINRIKADGDLPSLATDDKSQENQINIPAFIIFSNCSEDEETINHKLDQVMEETQISNKERWYISYENPKVKNKILKLLQAFDKKLQIKKVLA